MSRLLVCSSGHILRSVGVFGGNSLLKNAAGYCSKDIAAKNSAKGSFASVR